MHMYTCVRTREARARVYTRMYVDMCVRMSVRTSGGQMCRRVWHTSTFACLYVCCGHFYMFVYISACTHVKLLMYWFMAGILVRLHAHVRVPVYVRGSAPVYIHVMRWYACVSVYACVRACVDVLR